MEKSILATLIGRAEANSRRVLLLRYPRVIINPKPLWQLCSYISMYVVNYSRAGPPELCSGIWGGFERIYLWCVLDDIRV